MITYILYYDNIQLVQIAKVIKLNKFQKREPGEK